MVYKAVHGLARSYVKWNALFKNVLSRMLCVKTNNYHDVVIKNKNIPQEFVSLYNEDDCARSHLHACGVVWYQDLRIGPLVRPVNVCHCYSGVIISSVLYPLLVS